jgi:hypothetical protein
MRPPVCRLNVILTGTVSGQNASGLKSFRFLYISSLCLS